MSFVVSKDLIKFPQPGRSIFDGDAYMLISENLSRLEVVESGVSDVSFTVVIDNGIDYVGLAVGNEFFFINNYSEIPFVRMTFVPLTKKGVGHYHYPIDSMGNRFSKTHSNGSSGFTYPITSYVGRNSIVVDLNTFGSSQEAGVWEYRFFWDVYNIGYAS